MKKWDLPIGWEWKKLGSICEKAEYGYTTSASQFCSGPKFLRTTDISRGQINWDSVPYCSSHPDNEERYSLECGDILISRAGSVGASVVITNPPRSVFASYLIRFRPIKGIDSHYLGYFLKSKFFFNQLVIESTGTTLKGVNATNLSRIALPVPPIETQQKIVAILDKAEEIKRLRTEANSQTQKLIQSVFLDMFGDPVKNPKKWSISRIGNISSKISSGSTPLGGSEVYLKSGVLFIRSQNVLRSHLSLEDAAFINKKTHEDMKRTWVNHGDVLLNITGASIGRVAWYDGENGSANVNQHVCIIRPDQKKILPEFLAFQISIPSFQQKIMMRQSGATRQAFNYAQISDFNIIMPDITIQKHFVDIMKAIGEAGRQQHLLGLQLLSCQNNLLSQAFTGELVV